MMNGIDNRQSQKPKRAGSRSEWRVDTSAQTIALFCAALLGTVHLDSCAALPCNETFVYRQSNSTTLENAYDESMFDEYHGCGTKNAATLVVGATVPLLPWKFTSVLACFGITADTNMTVSAVLFSVENANETESGMPSAAPIVVGEPHFVELFYRTDPAKNLFCFSIDLESETAFTVRAGNLSNVSFAWIGIRYSTCDQESTSFFVPSRLAWTEFEVPNRYQLYPDSEVWNEEGGTWTPFVVSWEGMAVCESPVSVESSSSVGSSSDSFFSSSEVLATSSSSSSNGGSESKSGSSSGIDSLPADQSSDSPGAAAGFSTTIIIGIAVGGGVAASVALASIVVLALRWKRKKRREAEDAERGRSVVYETELVPMFDGTSESIGSVSSIAGTDGGDATKNSRVTVVANPKYEAEASKFAFAELGLDDETSGACMTTCTISELITVEPRKPTFGKMSVDDPTPAETKIVISHATSDDCAVSIFAVGFGGKAFRIDFPVKYDKDGAVTSEVIFVRERLFPKEKIELTIRAVACCSTTTTQPKLFVAAKTEPIRLFRKKSLRKSTSAMMTGTKPLSEEETKKKNNTNKKTKKDELATFSGKKSTQVIRISAHVAPSPKLDPDEFEDFSPVGEGSFGKVFRAVWKRGAQVVAVKTFKMAGLSQDLMKEITNEANIQSNLKNPYIVTFFGIIVGDQLAMVTEFFALGGLDKMIEKANDDPRGVGAEMTLALRIRYGIDVARGMDYLAKSGIVHRDLKPGNVLVASTNPTSDSPCCKITDFGTARTAIDGDDVAATCTKGVGTPIFMAPEVLTYDKTKPCYTEASDVYSYAILCYQLFSGLDPFPTDKFQSSWKVSEAVTSGRRPDVDAFAQSPIASRAARELSSVVAACWAQDPSDRPSFSAIVDALSNVIPAPN